MDNNKFNDTFSELPPTAACISSHWLTPRRSFSWNIIRRHGRILLKQDLNEPSKPKLPPAMIVNEPLQGRASYIQASLPSSINARCSTFIEQFRSWGNPYARTSSQIVHYRIQSYILCYTHQAHNHSCPMTARGWIVP